MRPGVRDPRGGRRPAGRRRAVSHHAAPDRDPHADRARPAVRACRTVRPVVRRDCPHPVERTGDRGHRGERWERQAERGQRVGQDLASAVRRLSAVRVESRGTGSEELSGLPDSEPHRDRDGPVPAASGDRRPDRAHDDWARPAAPARARSRDPVPEAGLAARLDLAAGPEVAPDARAALGDQAAPDARAALGDRVAPDDPDVPDAASGAPPDHGLRGHRGAVRERAAARALAAARVDLVLAQVVPDGGQGAPASVPAALV